MTGREFRAAGLDRVSDEELARLNDWIKSNLDVEAATDMATRHEIRREIEERVHAEEEGEEQRIVTTIPGRFEGWQDNTMFELAHGQVWKQVSGGSCRVSMDDPTVVIYPAAFGAWRIRVPRSGSSASGGGTRGFGGAHLRAPSIRREGPRRIVASGDGVNRPRATKRSRP